MIFSKVEKDLIHAALANDVSVFKSVWPEKIDIDELDHLDFELLYECFIIAKEADNTLFCDFLRSIEVDCWPSCKQLAMAIRHKSSSLIKHVFNKYQAEHNKSLFTTVASINGLNEYICLLSLCSKDDGFLNEKARSARIEFLAKHLDQNELILLATSRYAQHFYNSSGTQYDPIGLINMSTIELAEIASTSISTAMQRHTIHYAMKHLHADEFDRFIAYFKENYDGDTARYSNDTLWFSDTKEKMSLGPALCLAMSYLHTEDIMTTIDIKTHSTLTTQDMTFARNRSIAYEIISQRPLDEIEEVTRLDTIYILRFFIQRCASVDNFLTHSFWSVIKTLDNNALKNSINDTLYFLSHPIHIDTLAHQWPDLFSPDNVMLRDPIDRAIVKNVTNFYGKGLDYTEDEHSRFRRLLLRYNVKLHQIQGKTISEERIANFFNENATIQAMTGLFLLPEEKFIEFCLNSTDIDFNNRFVLGALNIRKSPTFWLNAFDDPEKKRLFLDYIAQ